MSFPCPPFLLSLLSVAGRGGLGLEADEDRMFPSEMNPSGGDKRKEGDVDHANIPMGRFGTEEEMAGLLLFLASPAGGYVDGDIVVIDGGRVGKVPSSF